MISINKKTRENASTLNGAKKAEKIKLPASPNPNKITRLSPFTTAESSLCALDITTGSQMGAAVTIPTTSQ